MRKRAGIGAIQKQRLQAEKYKDKGTELQESQFEQMLQQMEALREKLEEFAAKHRNEIKKNTQFRRQFQQMCAAIGVDPLASGKGFWSVLGMGDFYYELSVQVVEVCLAHNHTTGGVMELEELRNKLVAARGKRQIHQEITTDDILMAAKKLEIFGNGFTIVNVGKGRHLVQSIPGELSLQETSIVQVASNQREGYVTATKIVEELGWTATRAQHALEKVLGEGLAWIDKQGDEPSYWLPSLFPGRLLVKDFEPYSGGQPNERDRKHFEAQPVSLAAIQMGQTRVERVRTNVLEKLQRGYVVAGDSDQIWQTTINSHERITSAYSLTTRGLTGKSMKKRPINATGGGGVGCLEIANELITLVDLSLWALLGALDDND
ncbi:ESCRT-II complex subunit VPS22 [Anopheles darlingi]|uniref:Vacuolar-sorting protein SNF8 n=2 Tax=Anopheles darlingi TaxID=43151 RepID=W5JDF2_ANODA|nr:ESCRT-II complex subunit VPS22 [Anopheles darlingi]